MRFRLPKGTLRKRGDTWWMRYYFRGHPFAESLHTGDAEEARRLFDARMATVRADAVRGLHPAQARNGTNGRARLDGAWQAYLRSKSRPRSGPDTLRMYQYQFGIFLAWLKDSYAQAAHLDDVTEEIADGFLEHLEKDRKASPGTYNKHIATLRRTFRYAAGNDGRAPTPWDHARRKNGAQIRRREFSVDEVMMLIRKARGWMKTLFVLGLYTGQRLRDCCTLTWEQVDFTGDVIQVLPNKTKDTSGLTVELPMHPDLRGHLMELHRQAGEPKTGHVLPTVAERYLRAAPEVSREIQEFISGCGFRIYKDGTGVDGVRAAVILGFHSLRHTFVSICLRSEKVNRETIRAIVGDSYQLYNHVANGDKRKAIDQLPSMTPKVKKGAEGKALRPQIGAMSDTELRRMLAAVSAEMKRRKKSESAY